MDFKDRKKEIGEISEILESKKFEFLIIYGRRRIGKTELVLKATEKKKRVYYLAIGERNLDRFYQVCVEFDPAINKLRKDFEVLFDYLKDRFDIVIIDEFQNMIKEDPNVLNLFQSIIDLNLQRSQLKLILVGSSVSIITSKVLSYQSPLYGRRTSSFNLKAIDFFDLKYFFPNASVEELIEIYGFTDGIPFYLVKTELPFWSWLEKNIKTKSSFLRDEIDFLMRYEFDNPSTYKLILEAISFGYTKISEIKDFVKIQRTDITPYLKNLIDVDLIKREIPITENLSTRNGRYYLKDNFVKFWFRFIYPNLSSIEAEIFNIASIKQNYSQYLGHIFKDVAKKYLIKTKLFEFNKIGKWWWKDKEIDIVAFHDATKTALFGECKWQSNMDAKKIAHDLNEKITNIQWYNEERKEIFVIFAKTFSKKIAEFEKKKVYCVDLSDLAKI